MEEGKVLVQMDVMKLRVVNACVMMLETGEVNQDTMPRFKGSGYPMTIVY
jgi:hypothetical protein